MRTDDPYDVPFVVSSQFLVVVQRPTIHYRLAGTQTHWVLFLTWRLARASRSSTSGLEFVAARETPLSVSGCSERESGAGACQHVYTVCAMLAACSLHAPNGTK